MSPCKGMKRAMSGDQDRIERLKRAERLRWAREHSGLGGQKKVAQALGIKESTYKAHELGRNGFNVADARAYAAAFKVSLPWLYMDIGRHDDGPTSEDLRDVFERLQKEAPDDVQARIISYANHELRILGLQSLDTEASPAA